MRRGIVIPALVWTLLASSPASAVPAFSRQIHAGCDTCHFQGMGALNAFGRAFMMNNFSLSKKMRRQLLERERRKGEQRQKTPVEKGR